jgi:hypothetical protein
MYKCNCDYLKKIIFNINRLKLFKNILILNNMKLFKNILFWVELMFYVIFKKIT